ncbi:M14 family metallopeptidase [Brevibacillus thermoruber]|uniref:M14 family metallopeptidase n=1 Tax=Brevibacillus thermoruber TaxID=33942 RepID=UPI000491712E|nr:M14 family metallopeptidase [Brevibacillus thermoruber]
MTAQHFWTTDGLFYSHEGRSAPAGLRSRITVPSRRTCWESAAMVELAARIGLHMAELPVPIFDHLFIFDQLEAKSDNGAAPFHLVMGYDEAWLFRVLGEHALPIQSARKELTQESGLLYLLQREQGPVLVVTGSSPEMTLHAARALASDCFANGFPEHEPMILVPREISFSGTSLDGRDAPQRYSLHNLFSVEGLYRQNEDELHPTLDLYFHVRDSDLEPTAAAVELAARLALSAGYVCFPVTACLGESKPANRFEISLTADDSDDCEAFVGLSPVGKGGLAIHSSKRRIIAFVRDLLTEWFAPLDLPTEDTWRHRFASLQSASQDIQLRAQLGMKAFMEQRRGEIAQLVLPEHLANPVELWRQYLAPNMSSRSILVEHAAPVWTADWEDRGELQDMEEYLFTTLTRLQEAGQLADEIAIEVTTTTSEPSFLRWAEQLTTAIRKQWGISASYVYRDANKSGLHWAMQEVLPRIRQVADLDSIVLQARAFRPDVKHLDLVHRYLQELYPFDAILAKALDVPPERITLELLEEQSAPMFRIAAKNKQGKVLADWSWEGWGKSLPYMPDQPERGHVMIPFAGCRIYPSGQAQALASQSFETNPYRFWKWYQQSVLPAVVAQVGPVQGVPKFLRIECHVWMDAADNKVPHLEEVSSALEALHEDLYFYTLHALHEHGKQTGDPGWDAPGGIVPFMHHEPGGKPHARIALYALPNDHHVRIVFQHGEETVLKPSPADQWRQARIVSLTQHNGQTTFAFDGLADPALAESCGTWLSAAAHSAGENGLAPPATHAAEKSVTDDVFVNEDVQDWLEKRKEKIPGRVTPIDFSFLGQWIWLVELYASSNDKASICSSLKQTLYKPTLFINERHHANEVSSTNAALHLIEQVMADPSVLDHLNVVIVPLENVDGAALHAQMTAEHPCWKHHAARYNACGLEFAKYRFQPDVPFGESRVYPKVWNRWKPDIVLDDHGVPSHEWIQPFSGYHSPPRFPVSYWIPSARMYTIWRELTDATAEQREAYHSLRSFLTKRLDEDETVANDNREWLRTYIRWGTQFDEKHFPVELSHGSIAYTRHAKRDKQSYDLIERFPQWVTADLMTEVNDETVYGKELAACQYAHHVVHQAILDWLAQRQIHVELVRQSFTNGTVRIGLERKRPLSTTK